MENLLDMFQLLCAEALLTSQAFAPEGEKAKEAAHS